MATVTGMTASKMQQIADASIISGQVNELGNLILATKGGNTIDAGAVMDPLLPGDETQYYRGDKTWQALTRNAVGLDQVDNTSDDLKPVSTPQQTAFDKLAKGLLFSNIVTTNSGNIGAHTVTYSIPSFTFKAGRWYEISWELGYFTSLANNYPQLAIHTCLTTDNPASVLGLTSLRTITVSTPVAGNSEGTRITRKIKYATDTTRQIKFTAQIAAGGGTFVVAGDAGSPVHYTIIDLGASGA